MPKKQPTEVTVTYMIPVYVVVRNDQDGVGPKICKVVVDDEASFADGKIHRYVDGVGDDYVPTAEYSEAEKDARQLIETDKSVDWPGWDFGW